MTSAITPWSRTSFQPTGCRAAISLISFADRDVLEAASDLRLRGVVPENAPVACLDLRLHRYVDSPDWIDGWRTGAMRNIAARELGDDLGRLDTASCCYSIQVEVDDPADLTHLQLAWAVASHLAGSGSFAVLDAYACTWYPGPAVASLPPDRPFVIQREVSLTAETEPTPGFGHAVHTRGMVKFGRPDLIAGVPAERIEQTGRILNHLARMLADGQTLHPGQKLRIDGQRTLTVAAYQPDAAVPDVNLSNDGLLLVDA
jgi:hypothetical protein